MMLQWQYFILFYSIVCVGVCVCVCVCMYINIHIHTTHHSKSSVGHLGGPHVLATVNRWNAQSLSVSVPFCILFALLCQL